MGYHTQDYRRITSIIRSGDHVMQDGDRVRLVRGYTNSSQDGAPHGLWCGGKVPLGALGTLRHVHTNAMRIDFDKHEPRAGFYFGLAPGGLPTWLEIVGETET